MSSRKTAGHLVLLSLGMLFATIGSVGCGGGSDGGTGGSGSGGRGTGGSGSGGSGSGGSGTGGSASGGSGTGGSATGGSGSGGSSTGGSGTGGSASGGSGTGGAASGGAAGGATATGGAGGRGGSTGGAGGGATGGRGGGAGAAVGGRGGGTAGAGGSAASATATFAPLAPGTITGTAVFTQVTGGVQVVVTLANCPAGAHPIHIHEGTSCTSTTTQGMHWGGTGGPGENIGPNGGEVTCTSALTGTLTYTRMNAPAATAWTIGAPAGTNVVGHAMVVHSSTTTTDRHACGVIQAN